MYRGVGRGYSEVLISPSPRAIVHFGSDPSASSVGITTPPQLHFPESYAGVRRWWQETQTALALRVNWQGRGRGRRAPGRGRVGEGAARRRRRGGRASAAVMAVRERAVAAMAALERRVPSLDDFAGQSWSSWVERADLHAADGECSHTRVRGPHHSLPSPP